ncbi:MAG: hypothetical protein J7480_08970 [Microbacteriaceae bacterium]|nr:hypothetical protein [Microbacteriaceae bacterium]
MLPQDWTPYRRDDGEVLGWIRPAGEADGGDGELWVAVDLLGRGLGGPTEWLDAEAALEAHGIGWIAGRWTLDGEPVRIAEVSTERVVVVSDEYGSANAVGAEVERIVLGWPAPESLRRS